MKILLTGSSGSIGTRLFEKLATNHEVFGADIKPNRWHQYLSKRTIICDLRKENELLKLPNNVEMIIHLAANARVYNLIKEPQLALDNITMNFNILNFARTNDIKRILFASSREAYGDLNVSDAISESMVNIENCENTYAASKLAGEALTYAFSKSYNIKYIVVRFSNVYGMYDILDRVVPLWIKQLLQHQDLTIFGGDKMLDFVYIDDAIDGILKVLDRFDQVNGNVFNIASGEKTSLIKVAQILNEYINTNNRVLTSNNRLGEVTKFQADISKAQNILDYKPTVEIKEGLKRTANWYKTFYSNEGGD